VGTGLCRGTALRSKLGSPADGPGPRHSLIGLSRDLLEAGTGIEPVYEVLQTSA
jgi:hypothetical protein